MFTVPLAAKSKVPAVSAAVSEKVPEKVSEKVPEKKVIKVVKPGMSVCVHMCSGILTM